MPTSRADRLGLILDRLGTGQPVRATSLAHEFGISTATVRRDLNLLEQHRLLARVHGGARPSGPSDEIPVRYRDAIRRAGKQRIATLACDLLPRGRTVIGLSGGTTARAVAHVLRTRVDLAVVTNALDVAADLYRQPRITVVVTGGVARPLSGELVGPLVDRTLGPLRLAAMVLGVDGIDACAGATTHNHHEAAANAAMLASADRVIVVADGSKLGRVHPARIAAISSVHDLVTDETADRMLVERLRATGVDVHVAR